jgi:hypothetical protein
MQLRTFVLAAFAATCAHPAHAVHVNQQAFVANGGNLQDIPGSARNAFDQLRVASLAAPFNSVGDLGGCTGTWLGADATHAWVLTAAHCVPSTTLTRPVGHLTFRDAQLRPLAGGAGGVAFLHPNRLQPPTGLSDAGTDVALLRMPLTPGVASASLPAAPWIHDQTITMGGAIALVGTGGVGVANTPVDAYWPTQGQRRAWGETRIDSTRENGHVGLADFSPTQGATHWARAGSGDGGAAWWQMQGNAWSIIATTNGGNATSTSGALVAHYASWINDLFPGARLNSERVRVTQSKGFQSHNYSRDTPQGEVGYVVAPNQPGVVGPTTLRRTIERRYTVLTVPTRDAFGNVLDVKLRANRIVGACGRTHMDNANWCTAGRASSLHVWYDPADNKHLARHRWQGKLAIDALGWGGPPFQRRIDLEVDIDLAEYKGRVTASASYESPNIVWYGYLTSDNVWYTVDPQHGASGPTSAGGFNYYTHYVGHSTIVVNARSAVTQAAVPLTLRAQRSVQCYRWGKMNFQSTCGLYYYPEGRVRVWFDAADNPGLPPDRYLGEFYVRYHAPVASGLIRLEVEVDTLF